MKRFCFFALTLTLPAVAACDSDATGGGEGGSGGTATSTSTSTSTDTGVCVSGTVLPDPCCQPFNLPAADCPTEMPAEGSPCPVANGVCHYPENCGDFPDMSDIRLHCNHKSLTWRRYEPNRPICSDGFSEYDIACPCTPPQEGETCGFNVVSQISPCSYDTCEVYECENKAGSVWVLQDCAP